MKKNLNSFIFIFISLSFVCYAQKETKFLGDETTKIQDPFALRDPFKRFTPKSSQDLKKNSALRNKDYYSNKDKVENLKEGSFRVVGVLLGEKRKAIAKLNGEDGASIILEEGMSIGSNGATIKAIVPGGIVLVEKIVNVYDQTEYIETIIPISSD